MGANGKARDEWRDRPERERESERERERISHGAVGLNQFGTTGGNNGRMGRENAVSDTEMANVI
jgi:hypothetical protein